MEALVARSPKTDTYNLRMASDLKAKAAHVAEFQYLSLAALIERLLRKEVAAFEDAHGPIPISSPSPSQGEEGREG